MAQYTALGLLDAYTNRFPSGDTATLLGLPETETVFHVVNGDALHCTLGLDACTMITRFPSSVMSIPLYVNGESGTDVTAVNALGVEPVQVNV
jgi:hypothetical protein